jgi:tRNA pseudouridine55 synthase
MPSRLDRMSSSDASVPAPRRLKGPRAPRIVRRSVDGVLLLDKPVGISSNGACQRVKNRYRAESAGHTGTLDPFATGLLPIVLGEATKFASGLLEADKTYLAHAKLGIRTDTGDREGNTVSERPITHQADGLSAAIARLTGPIEQIPPMYSALKRDGRPLYEYARAGQTVERAPRPVTIHSLVVLDAGQSELKLSIRCSKGTYIRTLVDDLGEMLGCGAHLLALRRTQIGSLDIGQAVTLDTIETLGEVELDALLHPADLLVDGLPAVQLDESATKKLLLGQTVNVVSPPPEAWALVRAYGVDGKFLGLVRALGGGRYKPERLIRTAGE